MMMGTIASIEQLGFDALAAAFDPTRYGSLTNTVAIGFPLTLRCGTLPQAPKLKGDGRDTVCLRRIVRESSFRIRYRW